MVTADIENVSATVLMIHLLVDCFHYFVFDFIRVVYYNQRFLSFFITELACTAVVSPISMSSPTAVPFSLLPFARVQKLTHLLCLLIWIAILNLNVGIRFLCNGRLLTESTGLLVASVSPLLTPIFILLVHSTFVLWDYSWLLLPFKLLELLINVVFQLHFVKVFQIRLNEVGDFRSVCILLASASSAHLVRYSFPSIIGNQKGLASINLLFSLMQQENFRVRFYSGVTNERREEIKTSEV